LASKNGLKNREEVSTLPLCSLERLFFYKEKVMSKYRNRSNRSVPILDKQDELFDEEICEICGQIAKRGWYGRWGESGVCSRACDEEMTKRIIGHRGECDEQIL